MANIDTTSLTLEVRAKLAELDLELSEGEDGEALTVKLDNLHFDSSYRNSANFALPYYRM